MNKRKILLSLTLVFLAAGCATVSQKEALPSYTIGGKTYFSLAVLCNSNNIDWDYDTFSRAASLTKDGHKIDLRVGDSLALIDGEPFYLSSPVDLYEGAIVVPLKLKEKIYALLSPESASLPSAPTKIKKIVVDAGHGGKDPGATGRSGLREKDVNLDVAKRLIKLLRSKGVEVILTRSVDKFISLDKRVEIANNSGADLFVSVHSNANRVKSLNGFEVYYVSPSVGDSKRAYATAKATTINLDNCALLNNSLDLKATVWDMVYTFCRAEAIELSRSICRSMDSSMDARILGIKGARFAVLKGAKIPAILIEMGFVSNLNEERKLKNSYYRQKLAEAILAGIQDYSRDAVLMEAKR